METELAPLPAEKLRTAEEVFITSTAGGIMPVTRVDGEPIGGGKPGRVTQALISLYWSKHEDPAWTTSVRYQRERD